MQRTLKISNLLVLTTLIVFSCNRGDDDCPDCVYEVFECKVNGEAWGPDCDSGTILWGCSAIDCLYYNDTKRMSIWVLNEIVNQRISFDVHDVKLGTRPLHYLGREFKDFSRGNCAGYNLDTTLPHFVNIIDLDTNKYFVKGEFGFTAFSKCNGVNDTIVVTDGQFLLGYRF